MAAAPATTAGGASTGVAPQGMAAGAGLVLLVLTLLGLFLSALLGSLSAVQTQPIAFNDGVGDPYATRHFGAMYRDAAAAFGVNPYVLMAIHENESDYGRSTLDGVTDGVNSAGCCAGPMQFSITGGASNSVGGTGGTWQVFRDAFRDPRVKLPRPADYPNRFEPHPNVYDSYDAIYAAAKYLAYLHAGPKLDIHTFNALLHYTGTPPASIPFALKDFNRAKELEAQARRLQTLQVSLTPGSKVEVMPNGLAKAPADAPEAVKGMVAAANEISDRDYKQVHFPTHINNPTYDCSSSTSHVLWGGGKFGLVPWCSTSFMRYDQPGPGKWVTVYAKGPCGSGGHVFLIIGGVRFDTGHPDLGPNGDEEGPRWRLGTRPDMGNYVPRHPEGL